MIPNLEKEFLVFEVIDCVKDVKNAIEKDAPIDPDRAELLNDFNGFELKKLLERKGKTKVLQEIEIIDELFADQKVINAINEGISIAQQIYPSQTVKPIPIYLTYAGGSTDARAMYGGFVLNFGNLIYHESDPIKLLELVKSISAHETVHQFLEQIGVVPEKSNDLDDEILNSIWEEGLTTTVQTVQYPWHDLFADDYMFYAQTMNDWLASKGSREERTKILEKCLNRDSFKKFLEFQGDWYRENVLQGEDIDKRFLRLMTSSNGPAYHLGFMLWKKQIEKGVPVEKLVKGGHKQVGDWLKV